MRALSIRQPFAELILRGIKTVEYRSRPTRIIGERFLIYASKSRGQRAEGRAQKIFGENIAVPDAPLPEWMIEIAEQVKLIDPDAELPMGVIVGSAVIEKVVPIRRSSVSVHPFFEWHLTNVTRATTLRKPTGHPQPVWFKPF